MAKNKTASAPTTTARGQRAPKGVLRRLLRLLFEFYPVLLPVTLVCILFNAIVSSVPAIFMQNIIQIVDDTYRSGDWASVSSTILGLVALLVVLYILSLAAGFAYTQMMAVITQGSLKKLREKMFDHMQDLPIKYFDTNGHGDIMSYYTNDVDTLRQMISQSLPQMMISGVTLLAVFCIMMYVGGLSYKFIGVVLLITVPTVVILLSIIVHSDVDVLQGYQETRILAWLQPEKYSSDEAYQQNNSIMAIGSGRLTGKGLNNNTTTSVKNGNFILEPQTDFIFAIVGEELGFVGCCIVIGLLLLIVKQCLRIGMRAPDMGGRIICCGVASQIGIQSFINISVATGLFPNTGIPLPFVSYGMSSLVSMFIGIGLVLNVGLQQKKYK